MQNLSFQTYIDLTASSIAPHPLNKPITIEEINTGSCLRQSKSKAMGIDLIHNLMLDNHSSENKINLHHLFNLSLAHAFVPEDWKKSIVFPLLKAGKNPSDRTSYRPKALTSNLSKAMERIISNRIQWYMESEGLHHVSQAGFRKGRSTIDHIIQLELDIKRGFCQPQINSCCFSRYR